MIGSLFIGPTAALVDGILGDIDGVVAVVDAPRLAKALAERGRTVVAVSEDDKARERLRKSGVCDVSAALTDAEPSSLAAVVGVGAGAVDDWEDALRAWSRAVVEGGAVVLVDRAAPTEMTRRALCAGLMDIRQVSAGRVVATSGSVAKLPA